MGRRPGRTRDHVFREQRGGDRVRRPQLRLIELPSRIGVRALASDATGANRIYVGAGGDFGYLAPDAVGQLQFTSLMPAEARQDRSFDQVFTRQRRWRRRGESMRWSPWPVRWMIDGNHVPDPVGRHALDPRDVSDDFCDRSE